MAKNYYFNNFGHTGEQDLVESLVIESIRMYGHDVYFVPRTLNKKDDIYGEDQLSSYESAYDTEVYIKSYDSFEGDGSFLSKFNLEIRDQIIFTMAQKVFREEIGAETGASRPLEGDLFYSEMLQKLFIVTYVNKAAIFYQMGALQTWDITCEVFEYSNEVFNTGIPEIDAIQTAYSFAGSGNTAVSNSSFESSLNDIFADNAEINQESTGLIDWTDVDPFSEGNV